MVGWRGASVVEERNGHDRKVRYSRETDDEKRTWRQKIGQVTTA